MKSIIIILLLISTNVFGQTNYKTIMNQKKDSIPPIDLHLDRSQRLATIGSLMHLATLISLSTVYFLAPLNSNAYWIPVGCCAGSLSCHFLSTYEYKKSYEYQSTED